jgi:hypothetical protein
MSNGINGKWDGTMMDAEGFQTGAVLDLDGEGDIKGRVTYRIGGHHALGKEQSGPVRGKVTDGGVVLEFSIAGNSVKYSAEQVPARHHAKSALIGTYHVTGPKGESLAGGVGIFWLYA